MNVSSLYRRFASKEDLLRRLCGDGLLTYVEIARRAVDAIESGEREPWEAFTTFMEEIVAADTHALTIKLAGRFRPTDEEQRNAAGAFALDERLVALTQADGALRDDVNPHDLSFVFEQISNLHGATPERTAQLKARYLALHLDALRAPGRAALPGPPPTGEELRARWEPRQGVRARGRSGR